MLYPRLISEYLEDLLFEKLLAYPWHICITYSSTVNVDTAFSIEPQLNLVKEVQLERLQKDVAVIAADFIESIRGKAKHFIEVIDSKNENHSTV